MYLLGTQTGIWRVGECGKSPHVLYQKQDLGSLLSTVSCFSCHSLQLGQDRVASTSRNSHSNLKEQGQHSADKQLKKGAKKESSH